MPALDADLLLTLLGIALISFGSYVQFGKWKDWYWKTRGGVYGYIPLGMTLIVESNYKRVIPNAPRFVSLALLALLAILAVYLTLKQPIWIKPKWVRWLDSQPKRIRLAMQADAQQDKNWTLHTESQAAVEDWARKLRKGIKNKN